MSGFNPKYDYCYGEEEAHGVSVSGTGTISTLYMTDEELKQAKPKPLGFTAELPKKRRRKT